MVKPQTDPMIHKNQLLGAFEPDARSRITAHMQPVSHKLGEVICEAGGSLDHAYFPEGCVLSLLTILENGSEIECANIGREGAFGVFAAMYSRVSFTRCAVQLEGPMIRCEIGYLQDEFSKSPHCKICSSAIPRRCYRRSCRPSPATRFILLRRGCADGFS